MLLLLVLTEEEFKLYKKPAYCGFNWVLDLNRMLQVRSSCLEVFCKKGVLRNFAKLTGKQPCQSLFFNKVAGLRPAPQASNFIKKRLWHRCFAVNFAKFLKALFYRTPLVVVSRSSLTFALKQIPHTEIKEWLHLVKLKFLSCFSLFCQ